MVAAVFHAKLDAPAVSTTGPDARLMPAKAAPVVAPKAPRLPFDWRAVWLAILPPVFGLALLVAVWGLLTFNSTTFPTPAATFEAAVKLFADPF